MKSRIMHLAEWLPLKQVAIRSPEHSVKNQHDIDGQWQGLDYQDKPDFQKAKVEHAALKSVLEMAGAETIDLPAGPGLTLDAMYVRDTALPAPGGMIVTHMGKGARRNEPDILAQYLQASGLSIAGQISPPGMLEGGDCVWIDGHTLLIGRTYRTNDDGIRQAANILGPSIDIHVFHMPHYKGPGDVFHLMSVLSPVARDVAVAYLPLMPVPLVEMLNGRGIKLVEVPDNEFGTMACNVLALGNRKVVLVEGNPAIKGLLLNAGFDTKEISGTHICHPGQGGPTCLTLPLTRSSS